MDMGCNRRVHDDSKVLSWERFCIEVNNERVLTESFCQQKRHPADKKRSPKQNTPEGLSHSEEGEAGKDTSLKIILLSKGKKDICRIRYFYLWTDGRYIKSEDVSNGV
ncbi:uncharacterized protein LOC144295325 isoform X3 [Canis aureus]